MKEGKIHWIPAVGPIRTETALTAPNIKSVQEYVGGYVELVNVIFNNRPQQLIVNEEGLLKQLPMNWRATVLYGANAAFTRGMIIPTPIYGDAILFEDVKWD